MPKSFASFSSLLALAALACAGTTAPAPAPSAPALPPPAFDPIGADPPADARFPARLAEGTAFASGGSRMNGVLYEAAGRGPHPTVILLHGFPGNERNLDLAHALRRAGYDVVFFHYRGTWGSGGSFSFANVLEDVGAVIDQVREPEFAQAHRIDPGRIALVGHSMGGFAALTVASERAEVACVGSLAGANLGLLRPATPDGVQLIAGGFDRTGAGAIAGLSGKALVAELRAQPERFDLLKRAPALAQKPVLLVAGRRDNVARPDQHHAPLAKAIAAQPGARLRQTLLDDDHAFSASRVALAHVVAEFLAQDCFAQDDAT